jgi:hypothetical protein
MNYYQDHSQNGISVLSTTGAWLEQGHQNHVLPPNTHSFVGFVGNEFANDGRLQQDTTGTVSHPELCNFDSLGSFIMTYHDMIKRY